MITSAKKIIGRLGIPMTKLHQVLPKACEDYFYSNEVTLDRVELYNELLRIKKFETLHEYLVLKLKSAFSS